MSLPVGVFDSGLGGLTVVKELTGAFLHQPLIYLGDTQRCPYGPREQSEVKEFVLEIGLWLERQGARIIVIACNTATAAGLTALQEATEIPVFGMIDAGAQGACLATKSKRIGILATQGTINSGAYTASIHKIIPEAKVYGVAAPEFVSLVEDALVQPDCEGKELSEIFDGAQEVIDRVVATLRQASVDTVVLGCTHFPLLARQIQKALGNSVTLINPAQIVEQQVAEVLRCNEGELADTAMSQTAKQDDVTCVFATTSCDVESFKRAVRHICPIADAHFEHVDISDLKR